MRRPVIICLPLLVLVACSGGDDASSTTTVATPAISTAAAPTNISSEPSTTEPSTTAVATTAPPTIQAPPATTAAPDTTVPPDTTTPATASTVDPSVDEAVALQLAVIEQVEASWPAVRAVYNDPFNDELVARLDDFFAGRVREGLTNVVQQFRDGNFRTISREDQPEIYDADPRSLTVDLDAGRATVQACHVDTSILLLVGGNPDGSDEVRDDEVSTKIEELDLELIDGVWKITRARAPEVEISACP